MPLAPQDLSPAERQRLEYDLEQYLEGYVRRHVVLNGGYDDGRGNLIGVTEEDVDLDCETLAREIIRDFLASPRQ